ncbi:MAG: T9SS C-terminal target domain-containing protein, partial [Bacteroidia bacterium]|nr:T9SS C-terminal target domain-containing protein [Bacteroidia bacterium]
MNALQSQNIDITWSVPTTAVLGTLYQIHAWIEPVQGDTFPQNNYYVYNDTIRGSYDPNDKQVQPTSILPNQVTELRYLIRFQNTGTDTAFTVIIRDTLNPKLDISTFRILGASHPYTYSIQDQQVLHVFFHNILLPDSFTNEPKSHGYVQYAIKCKPGLTNGTVIPNTAYIYFDFNTPIQTNTVTTQVNLTKVISSSQ